MAKAALLSTAAGWLAGLLFSLIGLINTFWGNDSLFGVFIIALSLVFYPPVKAWAEKIIRFRIPVWALILIGLFILWASLGVGELFDKIRLMRQSF